MKQYPDLNTLLKEDPRAASYYNRLPEYVQEAMQDRADGVNSFESLCNYVDKLTRGDN